MKMRTLGLCGVIVVGCTQAPASGGEDSTVAPGVTDAATAGTSGGEAPTSGGAGETTSGETGEVVLRGACALADRVGGFNVSLESDYSAFSGAVADAVLPISVLEPVGEGGGCVMLRRNNPICDPPCQPSTTCDFSGECIIYPQNRDVGTVSVSGLAQPVVVMPVATFDYFDTMLPAVAFEPGAAITLEAGGGDYSPFTLHGEGVAKIVPTSDLLTMKKGQPLEIGWAAPEAAGAAQMHIELTIDQHGNTPVKLVCDGPDTGSLVVPAELIAQLIDLGISGFPSAQFYRQTVDSREIEPGCVDFVVRSHEDSLLGVEGHTPCNSPADCPDGQVCDVMLQTCK